MNNKLFPVVSTERNQQTKTKNKSDFLSSIKWLSTWALMSLFLLLPNESKAQIVKDSMDTIKTEQVAPVVSSKNMIETIDDSDMIQNKVKKALNDSTNVELQIFKSALWGVSMWSDIAWTKSFVEARLWWNGTYHITNWSEFSSKWVVDFSIMGKDVMPLGLATAELIITPTDNITIAWGYLTTPSTAGRMNPLTVVSNFENAWQKLMGPHTLGTWVKIDYTPDNISEDISASVGVFDINWSTEINASANYKWVRLSGWKNAKDQQMWGSIWVTIGKSSGTLTLDNGKFWWGANISLSPTVNVYWWFSGEQNQDSWETAINISEIWAYKTLQANKNTAIVAAGYNPNTKTLNLYLVIVMN